MFITYSSTNAPETERWCAYLTKFKVFTFGPTEEAAKAAAQAFYDKARSQAVINLPDAEDNEEAPVSGRGHANTGKVWMHKEGTGFARVPLTEISMYETNGYVRKGPRSGK